MKYFYALDVCKAIALFDTSPDRMPSSVYGILGAFYNDSKPYHFEELTTKGESLAGQNPVQHFKATSAHETWIVPLADCPLNQVTTSVSHDWDLRPLFRTRYHTDVQVSATTVIATQQYYNTMSENVPIGENLYNNSGFRVTIDSTGRYSGTAFNHSRIGTDAERFEQFKVEGRVTMYDTDRYREVHLPLGRYFADYCGSIMSRDHANNFDLWSEALSDVSLEANNVDSSRQLFSELISLSSSIKEGITLLPPGISKYARLATVAGEAWLTYRYVYSTTKMDIVDFLEKLDVAFGSYQDQCHTIRSSTKVGEVQHRLTARLAPPMPYHPSATLDILYTKIQELQWRLRSLGVWPSLQNLWDMVPYSFMVDWILPVGDLLGAVSTKSLGECFSIQYLCYSHKLEKVITYDECPVTISGFTREITNRAPSLEVNLAPSSNPGTILRRAVDTVAIFLL